MTRLLIINADDYGLTEGVSRGILRAHQHGVVRSTTMLANAPEADRAARWLREAPTLGVGVHLTLVGDDPPLSEAGRIPSLVDGRGRLRRSWRQLFAAALLGRIDVEDVRRELRAQIERVRAFGIEPTHVDAHQHTQLWPAFAGVVIELAREAGITAIRVPRSSGGRLLGGVVNVLGKRLSHRARSAGLAQTAGFAGFDEAGGFVGDRLGATIRALAEQPGDAFEIGVHPGEGNDPALARYAWGYRWAEELDALTDPRLPALIESAGFRLGSFRDLRA